MLLVGGGGFLGSHLRDVLRKRQKSCIIVSRNPSRFQDRLSLNETVISYHDVDNPDSMPTGGIGSVVYLVGGSSPGANPGSAAKEIVQTVVPASADFSKFSEIYPNATHILISSGGAVYGQITTDFVNETEIPRPISPYGLGKLLIEESLKFYARTKGFPFRILRVSNAVGVHHTNHNQGIVAAALRAAKSGQPLVLFGDGSAIRDYVHADDVADAILLSNESANLRSDIWNIGSGVGHSILDIVTLVERVTARTIHIQKTNSRPNDVSRIVLDCHKAAADLNWHPARDLASSIEELWNLQKID